jgi:tRNA pseudouridine55 synthase
MEGVLVIDKPSGPTSFDVVRRVRSLLRAKKVGHTGTLDPLATGVLPICLEEATKIAGHILQADKTYQAVVRLGVETDTLDSQGKVLRETPVPTLTAVSVEAILQPFRGTFLQTPPMYSAIKVDGKKLYELARAGEEIEREPRTVTVHSLVLEDLSAAELRLTVRCSKGFYVRSLAADLGTALGCGAHLSALRRTQTGPFSLAQALPLAELEEAAGDGERLAALVQSRLVTPADALSELASLPVNEEEAKRVLHGQVLEVGNRGKGTVRVLSSAGTLLALASVEPNGRLKYLRVMVPSQP